MSEKKGLMDSMYIKERLRCRADVTHLRTEMRWKMSWNLFQQENGLYEGNRELVKKFHWFRSPTIPSYRLRPF